jgi:hypothetical protein
MVCQEAERCSQVLTRNEASESMHYVETGAVDEILLEERYVAIICKRGDNSGASAASERNVQLLISCLH